MERTMVINDKIVRTILMFIVCGVAYWLEASTAGFDVLVIDAEVGTPIKGVNVVGWFSNRNGWKAWTESAPTYSDRKTTDKEGRCHVQGETNIGKTGVNIRNPPKDYYPATGIRYQFTQKPIFPFLHWRPTDLVITAALYKTERPVPLFVRRTILGNGQPISGRVKGSFGYDLIKASWLPPVRRW